ncbi:MAG: PolC-type DNA polymerase III [Vulcanibacillus sp.]
MNNNGNYVFNKLVESFNIPRDILEYFSGAEIEKVELTRLNNELTIYFSFIDLIPKKIYDQFQEIINNRLEGYQKVSYCIRFKSAISKEIILEYWLNIIESFKLNPSTYNMLKDVNLKIENQYLTIFVPSLAIKELLQRKEVTKSISDILSFWIDDKYTVNLECNEFEVNQTINNNELCNYDTEVIDNEILIENNDRGKKTSEILNKEKMIYGKKIIGISKPIVEINEEEDNVVIEGTLFSFEIKDTKNGGQIVILNLTDLKDSIQAKLFIKNSDKNNQIINNLKIDMCLRIKGNIRNDAFSNELVLLGTSIMQIDSRMREDTAEEKRVELHLHTNMSAMDGITSINKYLEQASIWGHKAIAITDHGVAQSFPEAYEAGQRFGIKIVYGLEANVVDDTTPIVFKEQSRSLSDDTYVVFDTETTGLSAVFNKIIEIGAVKVKEGKIVDKFEMFVDPQELISTKITELTGITNEMVKGASLINEVLLKFKDFIGESILVAHNAKFDLNFLNINLGKIGENELDNPLIDTVELARFLYPNMKNYKLNTLCKQFNIELKHHRAYNDAEATSFLLLEMVLELKKKGIENLNDINKNVGERDYKKLRPFHLTILVKNYIGLKNLYKIISKSHIDFFYRCPRIPRNVLTEYREGLLFGTACNQGELFNAMISKTPKEIEEIIKFYDYLEIQPIKNYKHLINNGLLKQTEDIIDIHNRIIELGEKLNIPVVATGDVHYLNPEEEINRKILVYNQIGGYRYHQSDDLSPAYYHTTNEMYEEFAHLDKNIAKKIIVDNPNKIVQKIENMKPYPDGLHSPIIDGADDEIRQMSYNTAKTIYGDHLPEIVEKRLEKELQSIIENGFAVIYLISHKLVNKSLEDGFIVGSRGSVGSSFVATMTKITEVNPLPPHYICGVCKHNEFVLDGSYGSGYDLPDKECPNCHNKMNKEGQDIPFETFMGYKGDKVPDIDLNFSGNYQATIHKYAEEVFGSEYVYRAGTISTIAEKTAYGYVKKYSEDNNLNFRNVEISRLVLGCTGIKRTTGQHPGGLMIIPQYKDVYDFTPIQKPADDMSTETVTTHFDYHAISGRLLKLDILGHDDPTVIRMLEDLTGIEPKSIPMDDLNVYEIFRSTKPLGLTSTKIRNKTGTVGIPEFGTKFVRQMLEDTKPTTFSELVRISGLSHGTDVWLNNAQELIKDKKAKLSEVICTRDDIMLYLIQKGLDTSIAFNISENVRKGKGLDSKYIEEMSKFNVPDWYIKSCQKIKYMFPKAHAVAYVQMAVRIAYFKVYYPIYYYATYFSIRADEFIPLIMTSNVQNINNKIEEILSKGNSVTQKEKNLLTVLEVALEMLERGFYFQNVDLYKSDSTKFLVNNNLTTLIPPFKSISGIGENAANNIIMARKQGDFLSIEDFQTRSKVSKTVIEILEELGSLKDLPSSNQLSLF